MKDKYHVCGKSDAEILIQRILDMYTDAGFAFCKVYPERTDYDNATALHLRIEENERITISDVLFNIKGKTLASAARKIANITTKTYFSRRQLEHAKINLQRKGIFKSIHENIAQRDAMYYIILNLDEQESDYITASGSLADQSYLFNLSFYSLNLLGTLRTLQFSYEYEKLFSLEFSDPVLISPIELKGNFSLWTYDSVRLLAFDGTITAPIGRYFSVLLTSGIENVSYYAVDSTSHSYTSNKVGAGLTAFIAFEKGEYRQSISFDHLFRANNRWRVQYDGALRFFDFAIRPHYRMTKTDSFEHFDYYRIGGAHDLRGYLDEEFMVTKAFWVEGEYRRFIVFPLFDIGLIEGELRYSYGFGIEARSALGRTSLAIAWPQKATWRDGKIHLLFERSF